MNSATTACTQSKFAGQQSQVLWTTHNESLTADTSNDDSSDGTQIRTEPRRRILNFVKCEFCRTSKQKVIWNQSCRRISRKLTWSSARRRSVSGQHRNVIFVLKRACHAQNPYCRREKRSSRWIPVIVLEILKRLSEHDMAQSRLWLQITASCLNSSYGMYLTRWFRLSSR